MVYHGSDQGITTYQDGSKIGTHKDKTAVAGTKPTANGLYYKARHAHKRLYTVLPKYSKIQVLPGITSCRLMKYNKQAIELNSLLINNMPKDGYGWS